MEQSNDSEDLCELEYNSLTYLNRIQKWHLGSIYSLLNPISSDLFWGYFFLFTITKRKQKTPLKII